jgi:hypothetical protein
MANTEIHFVGGIQSGAWYIMRDILGQEYVDSLVFYSSMIDVSTHGHTMRSILILDDDDGDLSNGTPNFTVIKDAYEARWIGPFVPFVFRVNDRTICTSEDGIQNPKIVEIFDTYAFEILDTYPMDSLEWDFGDGSAPMVQVYDGGFEPIEHAYDLCGDYFTVCQAFHTWGSTTDTLLVLARAVEGCPNYICGDVDNDRDIDENDVDYLSDYMFNQGPEPTPLESGDVDCITEITISDLVYLVEYVYENGPAPCSCGASPEKMSDNEYDAIPKENSLPEYFALNQNIPNPFNPSTQIMYAVPEAGNVTLEVYNILGQQIVTLVDGEHQPGFYSVEWNGRDEKGQSVASGIYLYRLKAGDFVESKKMMLIK